MCFRGENSINGKMDSKNLTVIHKVAPVLSIIGALSCRFKSFQFSMSDVDVYQCLLSDGERCFLKKIPARKCNLGKVSISN